ncbi:MAG: hypothetical protein F6K36_15725 [Symploca sp. SIO3C6]|uniref:Septum formation initiator family protein n=1 Tax=Symploca sp. SIO1C4 TaxID=2607765 RepID=A0A6B3NKH8_9CYAN|nr:hypothetical protein [Symploca sp. SIO3C6]NER29748.1 hypothetical protein [Symploca sp. SIO1C4]NET04597.1 hypothetical protein [Symploca sp. SIO2B6]
MNSIKSSRPTRQPLKPHQKLSRTQKPQKLHYYRAIVGETTLRLVVNIVISTAAIAGLVQLLPYQLSQQSKLQEVRREVKRTQARVNNLRNDFSRSFDPRQAQRVMQEQTYRFNPSQRQVVWKDLDDFGDY